MQPAVLGSVAARWMPISTLLLWLSLVAPSAAQPPNFWAGDTHLALPEYGATRSGFTLDLTVDRLHRFGDIPLHVNVYPTGRTFVEDRQIQLQLVLQPASVVPRSRSTSYQLTLTLPEGSGPLQQTFYLPKWVLGGTLTATVLEGGQPLAGYRGQFVSGSGHGDAWEAAWMESAEGNFCWIAAPGSTPLAEARDAAEIDDLRSLLAVIAPELLTLEPLRSPQAALPLLRQYGRAAGLGYRTAEEVPTNWKGVAQSQVWITRWSTYRWLAEHRPEAELALRQFVRCGGALWLLEVDDQLAFQTHFNTAFDPATLTATDSSAETTHDLTVDEQPTETDPLVLYSTPQIDLLQRNYFANASLLPRRALVEQVQAFHRAHPSRQTFVPDNLFWLSERQRNVEPNDTFTLQLGVGLIIGSRLADTLTDTHILWRTLLNLSQERTSSVLTRGVDPVAGDSRFWNWVIPGVAQPPVYTFIGLLMVFVILVGPVAYRKLNRMGRSYLMFVVAPLLALATTLFLFAYGLIADGLGTQARIRQITWICDRDGGALRYWRSTYFAGIRPRDGLSFPGNTHLEPYYLSEFSDWHAMNGGEGVLQGNLALSDEAIRLSSGFLPSRQQRQFVAYRPVENAGGLSLSGGRGASPRVESHLDFALREVILRAEDGQYWGTAELPAGQAATLTLIADVEIARTLSDLYVRNRPELPEGLSLGRGRRRSMELLTRLINAEPWRGSAAAQRASGSEGWLEWHLQDMLQTTSMLRPGTFVALADVTEDCVAVPSAKLVQSIHYVLGELQ